MDILCQAPMHLPCNLALCQFLEPFELLLVLASRSSASLNLLDLLMILLIVVVVLAIIDHFR
jgi:hypothetical protein